MSKTVVFATGNQNKVREVRQILDGLDVEVRTMKEMGITSEPEETGETFEENAMIKAAAIADEVKDAIVLADDSGLEIDYLNGEPGIYSARYLGEDTSYEVKNAKLIERLEGVPKEERTARFVCAIACILPDGSRFTTRGTIEGYIGWEPAGTNGFGYDPIFYVDEYGCSTAQMTAEQKNAISHRGNALRALRLELEKRW
jgi:XTP/dITP diphosphohydrolase